MKYLIALLVAVGLAIAGPTVLDTDTTTMTAKQILDAPEVATIAIVAQPEATIVAAQHDPIPYASPTGMEMPDDAVISSKMRMLKDLRLHDTERRALAMLKPVSADVDHSRKPPRMNC